ncbi:TRAP transporter solute receptor TAXI family protein [Citreicella sp. 357]|nr:TRAP transporter solute receptor TAXI family protein [Citreicella sp. 357]
MTVISKKGSLWAGLLGLAATCTFGTMTLAQDRTELGLATSASGGTGYMYAVAVATVVNEDSEDLKITPFPSAGVVENDRLLRGDEAQLILHTGGEAYDSYRGKGRYPSAATDLRAILPIYASLVQIVASADTEAARPGDLKGKRVGLGEPGSSANTYVRQALEAEGVKDGDYDARPNSLTEQVAGVRDGNLDVLSTVMGAGAPALQDLATSRDVRWISVSSDTLQAVMEMNPPGAVVPVTIPADTYAGQDSAVQTFGVPIWIMGRADLPDTAVTQILTRFLGNMDRASEVHPIVKNTTKDFVAGAMPPVPWHDAAVNALKETGYAPLPFKE